jgi:hypothetical protein
MPNVLIWYCLEKTNGAENLRKESGGNFLFPN